VTLSPFSSIPAALTELQQGKMLIVVDDPTRENQGDIVFPAESITTEKANFLMKECRGMFCVPMTKKRAAELEIPLMLPKKVNTEKFQCNFGITVDVTNVTSHGISASDRALTVKALANKQSKPADFLRPGHVSPIIAVDGGVVERNGHTEATIDLARLAGFDPIGVLSEIIRDDGATALLPDLITFSQKHESKNRQQLLNQVQDFQRNMVPFISLFINHLSIRKNTQSLR
jgi:3,4-dihydroxy 2-butanone 4-phosphate synthase/GTP cyclohydrolase II